jgi:rubredoxin
MKCPTCGNEKLDYDSFEDMYRCGPCYSFFYPDEVEEKDNLNAPIFQLHIPETI